MSLLLDPEARPVIAHRGNSAHAPEDTLEAFLDGMALGADGIECDVHLSRDGHVVVMHDAHVDRTTDGTGAIASLTLAELRRLDAGFRFTADGGRTHPWRGRGVAVPTLDELLDALGTTPLIVEVKTPDASLATRRVLERHGAAPHVLVGSFSDRALAPFRGSAFPRSASRREVVRLVAATALGRPRANLPYDALCIPPFTHGIPVPVLMLARAARYAGVRTHVWTVDDPRRARHFWDGGVNAIITNDPARILPTAGRAPHRAPLAPV